MRALVTGANGFLGRRVVAALLARDVTVRALVRPATDVGRLGWGDDVEIARSDLRSGAGLDEALADVDVVIHLAACVAGSDEERFASTVVGSEKLIAAMEEAGTTRLVLASTFSVYDWSAVEDRLDESSPLLREGMYERDGYAVAKSWQEGILRQAARRNDWDLRVLRPGFIWGDGNSDLAGVGQRFGPFEFVFGLPERGMPLTHVDNCADCFATVALDERAAGQTFNVVDDEGTSAWRYCGDWLRGTGRRAWRIPVPYAIAYGVTRVAQAISRAIFEYGGKLPSILVPCRFEARFKPVRFSNRKLAERVDWTPPHDYAACLDRTFRAS